MAKTEEKTALFVRYIFAGEKPEQEPTAHAAQEAPDVQETLKASFCFFVRRELAHDT